MPIYITGHRNPDTDSICSAIAYAELKQLLGFPDAKAYRLGEINKETRFALDYFGVDTPELLDDVRLRVGDLDLYKPDALSPSEPLEEAWRALDRKEGGAKIIPVTDSNNRLIGTVSLGDLTQIFINSMDESIAITHEILYENLLRILSGSMVYGQCPSGRVNGGIYIASSALNPDTLTEGDLLLTAQPDRAAQFSTQSRCGCVILCGGAKPLEANSPQSPLMNVPYSLFKTANMLSRAISIKSVMRVEPLVSLSRESFIDDIIDIIKTSAHRNFPVVDREGCYVGILSRRHLIEYSGKRLILVDHNEQSQSADGLEQAEILEIIDHHRIADIQTRSPVYIRSEPVGSTATIIFGIYREQARMPSRQISGLLLSAILSDTIMFSSPTSTDSDRLAAAQLAMLAGVDYQDYGRKLFAAGSALEGLSAADILDIDRKPFSFGQYTTSISQVNTIDFDNFPCPDDELLLAMEAYAVQSGVSLVVLMITDIVSCGSRVLFCGKARQMAAEAFGASNNSVYMPGVVSRKKQIVPKLSLASQGL